MAHYKYIDTSPRLLPVELAGRGGVALRSVVTVSLAVTATACRRRYR